MNKKTLIRLVRPAAFLICAATAAAADLHPVVEVQTGYFFGATRDGKWIKAAQAAKSVQDGTVYRVYDLTKQVGETKGGIPKADEDVCPDNFAVELKPTPEHGAIALAATWNPFPRKVRSADVTQQVYIDVVRDFLIQRGIRDPKMRITKIVRVDLDGDGEDEVLISATNYFAKDDEVLLQAPRAGSYSMVLLRRVVAGKVRTKLLAGEFYPKPDSPSTPNMYEISAVLDLNGDGKFEIVIHSMYYEGGETTIYQCEPEKITPLLNVACGV